MKHPLPAVMMLGAFSQVGQVLLLREFFAAFQGNEVSIGLILAAWMSWVGIGGILGAFVSERTGSPSKLLVFGAAGMLVALPMTILLIRGLRGFFDILPGAYMSLYDIALACFILMAPACLLIGAQFVFLSRAWREKDGVSDTSGAHKAYAGEAAGNMIGGILFTFIMIRFMSPLQSAALAAALMLAASAMAATGRKKTRPYRSAMVVPALLAGLFLLAIPVFPVLERADNWAYRLQWRQFMPGHELAEIRHSKHGVISVLERAGQYSFFQSGHLIFSTAGADDPAPGIEDQDAVAFAHLAMVQHDDPRSVLLIGGGLRGTLGAIARHPVERIVYIEIDETLAGTAASLVSSETLCALSDPRVSVIHTDGRLFVKTAEEKYDMLIVDLPDPATAVLNRFYTREFFLEAKSALRPGGVLVIGATSTPDLRRAAVANRNATIYHTLRSVFDHVLPAGETFMFFFASNEPERITLDVPVLQQRYTRRNIASRDFSAAHFQSLLQESRVRRVNWIIRNHGRRRDAHLEGAQPGPIIAPSIARQERDEAELDPPESRWFVNSDFRPIGYYYTIMFWEELTRAAGGRTFAKMLRVEPGWIFPIACLPLLAAIVLRAAGARLRRRIDTRFAVLYAVWTTGLSTMALQVALIFSFQSVYGFVYETVGLIIAVFMSGLALGAHTANRLIKDKSNLNVLAGMQLLIAVSAGLVAVALPKTAAIRAPAAVPVLFGLLTFAAGLVNGIDFPLEAACYMALDKRAERSAGLVYAMELFGACTGAVAAGILVAPVMGIVECCLMAAAAGATSFAVLLICRRSYA